MNPKVSASQHNARLGLVLFLLYCLFYAGFMLINAFSPKLMETTPIAGLNLAVLYGMFLIVAAFVLAMVYGMFARNPLDVVRDRGADQ